MPSSSGSRSFENMEEDTFATSPRNHVRSALLMRRSQKTRDVSCDHSLTKVSASGHFAGVICRMPWQTRPTSRRLKV